MLQDEIKDKLSLQDADALNYIGYFFERDIVQTVEFYRMGATSGGEACMINLGGMYEDGLGVKADMKKAQYWYDKAKEIDDYEN